MVVIPELRGPLRCGICISGVTRAKSTGGVSGLCLLPQDVIPGTSLKQQQRRQQQQYISSAKLAAQIQVTAAVAVEAASHYH
jgi:hypothetical protein